MKAILFFGAVMSMITQAQAQSTVFNENFDATTGSSLPAGWVTQDLAANGNEWETENMSALGTPISGFSGRICVTIGNSVTNTLLTSPVVNLTSGTSYTLTYMVGTITLGVLPYDNHYAVYIIPSSASYTGSETPILEETITAGQTAFARTINLSSYAGQNIKMYFRQFNSIDKGALTLDDVKITQSVLATSETSQVNKAGIYPNPVTDYLNIKSRSKIINTEIYDMTGKKINTELNTNKIDVRNLQVGNYIINIATKEGIVSHKFTKK